ncbi:MAG TPA: UDP-2,3-diacylglucosamine diphosphatase LpxI [bacterium]|nr:UDP-2,3-diacylglucosamine diphosphatase LpxI [bacterium]
MREPLGLIAGEGELPLLFARQARRAGYRLCVAALKGAAPASVAGPGDRVEWVSVGQLGKMLAFFKREKVRRAVMHGRVRHASIFSPLGFDWRALALLARVKDRSGPALLAALAGELARAGVRLLDGRFLMKDCLVPRGIWTRVKPTAAQAAACRAGWAQARALARAGVGQSLLVKNGAVVAVEAMEGTDRAVARAGALAGKGIILIKTAGPRQDWRFDIPTVGPTTLKHLARVRAAGLVVEAGKTFLLQREKTLALAARHGLFLQAV